MSDIDCEFDRIPALDEDSLVSFLKITPLTVDQVSRPFVVELLLPEIGVIDQSCCDCPCYVPRPANVDERNDWYGAPDHVIVSPVYLVQRPGGGHAHGEMRVIGDEWPPRFRVVTVDNPVVTGHLVPEDGSVSFLVCVSLASSQRL